MRSSVGEPVVIIGLAGIGIAGGLRLLDFFAERRRPFLPGEHPRALSDSASAKASASHGARNTGPSSLRGMLWHRLRRAKRGASGSCRLQIGLKGFDRDFQRGLGVIAP